MSREKAPEAGLADSYAAFEDSEISLRDILTVVFRHKTRILACFAVVVSTVTVASFLIAETYESEAKLLIRVGRESVSVDPSVSGPTMGVAQNRRDEINSELGILTSTLLFEQVVDEIGADVLLDQEPSEVTDELRASAVNLVSDSLTVEAEKDSHIITLSFGAGSPELARHTLEKLLQAYLQHHIDVHSSQASPGFFKKRSALLLQRLMAKEVELESFRRKHAIAAMDEQKELLLAEISGLQTAVDQIDSEIVSTRVKIRMLEENLRTRSAVTEISRVKGLPNAAADEIKATLVALKLDEIALMSRYRDDERPLIELREQIKLTENQLVAERSHTTVTTGIDRNYQQLQLDLMRDRSLLTAGKARSQALTQQLRERKTALSQLTAQETELSRRQRQLDIAEQEYREYVDSRQRADISAALDSGGVSNVSVVQPASLPIEPVEPRKLRNIALSLLVGLFGGIGVAFLLEMFDDSIKSRQDVARRLGLPVLATFTKEEYRECT